jgi:hypothetical protein
MKDFWQTIHDRWRNAMPKFFSRICWVCALISGTALAANTAVQAGGGTTHEWWNELYPYLLGVPAGMAFVAKFTQNYDKNGEPIRKDVRGQVPGSTKSRKSSARDLSPDIPNNCDMVAEQPSDKN